MRKRRSSKGRFTKTRKTHKRRKRNGGRKLFHAARAAQMSHAPKRRKKARKSRRKARASKRRVGRRIRPTIIMAKSGKYYRPRRSKYFKKPRRINGRRRRANGSKSIMAAVKNVFQVRTISRYAAIGGGIFAGTLFSRMLNTGVVPFTSMAMPQSVTQTLAKVRPFHGLLHILAGTLIASKVRNKYIQDAGLGIAALGGFDLLMQLLSKAGMVNLPTFSGMNVNLLGATQYGDMGDMSGMNVDLRATSLSGAYRMGDGRSSDAESNHIADNINDMLG